MSGLIGPRTRNVYSLPIVAPGSAPLTQGRSWKAQG